MKKLKKAGVFVMAAAVTGAVVYLMINYVMPKISGWFTKATTNATVTPPTA